MPWLACKYRLGSAVMSWIYFSRRLPGFARAACRLRAANRFFRAAFLSESAHRRSASSRSGSDAIGADCNGFGLRLGT